MLHKPEAGRTLQVSVHPDRTYLLDFFTDTVTFDQKNADVCLFFEDGARILLHDFLRVTAHDDFTLELPDGTELSGRDVADAMNMALQDFHTDSLTAEGADGQDGGILLAAAVSPGRAAPPEDDLAGLLEPPGSEFAPFCDSSCILSGTHPHSGLPFDAGTAPSGLVLTPHLGTPGESPRPAPPSGDVLEGTVFVSPSLSQGAGEILQIEDLLDTSQARSFDSAHHAPAFERLLDPFPAAPPSCPESIMAPPAADNLGPAPQSDTADDASDQLLQAFLRMGTY